MEKAPKGPYRIQKFGTLDCPQYGDRLYAVQNTQWPMHTKIEGLTKDEAQAIVYVLRILYGCEEG